MDIKTIETPGNTGLLVCVGAGPKTMAVVLLAATLRKLGRPSPEILVIERAAVGAHWSGEAGFTDGRFPLDTSPLKDLGFPYDSGYGPDVDHELGHCSYPEYLKHEGRFACWVSRGQPAISHAEFARYLRWVGERHGLGHRLLHAELRRADPAGPRVELTLATPGGERRLAADGVMLTGPGEPRRLPAQDDDPRLIHDARSYWAHRAAYRGLDGGRVAVLGGGQSAGTVAKSLADEAPGLRIDVINRHGFLAAQSAGYSENLLCTTGEGWGGLTAAERREVLERVNNGVVSAEIKAALDHNPNVRVLRGTAREARACGDRVRLTLAGAGGTRAAEYDRVVVAIGFDPLAQLGSVLPTDLRGSAWFAGLAADPTVDRHLRLPGLAGAVHAPALAGLSQGPGLPLLSCLGTLAARVVSAYAPPGRADAAGVVGPVARDALRRI